MLITLRLDDTSYRLNRCPTDKWQNKPRYPVDSDSPPFEQPGPSANANS